MAASEPVPSSREFTFVGVAYGIYVMGLFLFWPLLAGVALAYVKRSDVEGTMLASHYRWLIHTFWWWSLAWTVIVAGMLSVIVPNAMLIAAAARSGDLLNIPWALIGAAVGGGIALAVVWFWAVYRLFRGILRLSDGRAVP
jgi:uncharacterized membrane protein